MSQKVCLKCKLFVTGDTCPICGGNNFTTTYYGKISILNPNKSKVAKTMGITYKGQYAIKVR